MSSAANFVASGACFVQLISAVRTDDWDHPAMDGWTVRSLAGHTTRAILTVETYLLHDEPDGITVADAEHYYSAVYPALFDLDHIRADGVSAGRWLGADPVAHASDALARTRSLVDSQPSGRIVSIGGMGIALDEYLRTRVVELVLHTLDLSEATGIDHGLPDAALHDASLLVASIPEHLRHGEGRLVAASVRAG